MERVAFTGFDVFLLALEKQYAKRSNQGNICRYVIDLDGHLNKEELQNLIKSSETIDFLNSLGAEKPNPFFTPYWKFTEGDGELMITEHESEDLIPEAMASNQLSPHARLISFDLVRRAGGFATLIFSWHHLLMDGFGAALLLKHLFGHSIKAEITRKETAKFTWATFTQAVKAKFFIDTSSRPPISSLTSKKAVSSGPGLIRVITFNESEVKQIDAAALQSGAKFGRSAFYLACCSRAVKSILEKRGEVVKKFWIPVPVDDRKKGASGPIVGNKLSFLFYRITNKSLNSKRTCVDAINAQMVNQIGSRIPQAYNHLMNYIKWLPLGLYLFLVKRRGGNSIASFLFTVAAEHPAEFTTINNCQITNALSLPANPNPPGLTFAFMKFRNSLQLMMLYHPEALSNDEMKFLEEQLVKELLAGDLVHEKN